MIPAALLLPLAVVAPLIVYVIVEPGQFSIPSGFTSAELVQVHTPASAHRSTNGLGHDILGIALSNTVIVKLHVVVLLPHLSVAVNTMVVIPNGNV